MRKKDLLNDPLPVRFTDNQEAMLKRISEVCGVAEVDVARWAVSALGSYFRQHDERLLLPVDYVTTFSVYEITLDKRKRLAAKDITIREFRLHPSNNGELKLRRETAFIATDPEGRIRYVNQLFANMCGYSIPELLGRKPSALLQGEKTEKDVVREFRKAIREAKPFSCELTNYRKDRSTYKVRIDMRPVLEHGRVVQFEAEEEEINE